MNGGLIAAVLAAVSLPCSTALAQILYAESFDVDATASWIVNDPSLSDVLADFHYDYSAIGVPPAPGSATTLGMKLTANNVGGVFSGFSVSPAELELVGDYTISFQLWQNYVGPLGTGGSGTTQLSMFGFGTAGDVAVWPGALPKESVTFGVTLDGGSSIDYREYDSAYPTGRSVANGGQVIFSSGDFQFGQDGSHPYYADFGGEGAPAAQLALYPGQIGATDPGEISFAWRKVVIDVSAGIATWSIDDLEIAQLDVAPLELGGGSLLFGHSDTNATLSADPNAALLNVTIVDEIRVVPEPGSLGPLLSALSMGALARRRARRV